MTYHNWTINGYLGFLPGDFLLGSYLGAILKDTVPPIGTIISWNKVFTPTVSLPSGWVECNGQLLDDINSPLNGSSMPNLNGSNNNVPRMLLGSLLTGEIGGVGSHQHSVTTDSASSYFPHTTGASARPTFDHTHSITTDLTTSIPPYYCVVYIIRVK